MSIVVFVLLGLGILNAAFLRSQTLRQERTGRSMICPLGADCYAVVSSRYGRMLFGVKNEYFGIAAYVAIGALVVAGFPAAATAVAAAMALASVYLLIIQLLILLKNWCSWCVLSSLINGALFVALYYTVPTAA